MAVDQLRWFNGATSVSACNLQCITGSQVHAEKQNFEMFTRKSIFKNPWLMCVQCTCVRMTLHGMALAAVYGSALACLVAAGHLSCVAYWVQKCDGSGYEVEMWPSYFLVFLQY